MKKFITFGAGGDNYIQAGERLIKQAKALNLFDELKLFTDVNLKNDTVFWNQHSDFITNNSRGYGYWLWKPYIVKKTMETMKDGDILLYLDGGCEINVKKKNKLIDLFNIVKKDYIIGSPAQTEEKWNKMDLILELKMLDKKYMKTPQRQAGTVLYLVCDKTRALVNEWYNLACNYHFIDDTPSINKNLQCFKEHRHDQSIYSLLTKKYNLYSNRRITEAIECLYNRSGKSKLR